MKCLIDNNGNFLLIVHVAFSRHSPLVPTMCPSPTWEFCRYKGINRSIDSGQQSQKREKDVEKIKTLFDKVLVGGCVCVCICVFVCLMMNHNCDITCVCVDVCIYVSPPAPLMPPRSWKINLIQSPRPPTDFFINGSNIITVKETATVVSGQAKGGMMWSEEY